MDPINMRLWEYEIICIIWMNTLLEAMEFCLGSMPFCLCIWGMEYQGKEIPRPDIGLIPAWHVFPPQQPTILEAQSGLIQIPGLPSYTAFSHPWGMTALASLSPPRQTFLILWVFLGQHACVECVSSDICKVSCSCYCVHATTHREIPDIFCRLCVSFVHTTLCICTMNIYASATQVTNLHVGHARRRSRSGRFDTSLILANKATFVCKLLRDFEWDIQWTFWDSEKPKKPPAKCLSPDA